MLVSPLHSDTSLSFGPKCQATIHSQIRSVVVMNCPVLNPILGHSSELLLKCVVFHTFILSNRSEKSTRAGNKIICVLAIF